MLEKPDLPEELINACLRSDYGFDIEWVEFLPLGYDVNTAVYRVKAKDQASYFLKIRKSGFHDYMVTIPYLLSKQGIQAIIPPIQSLDNKLYAKIGDLAVAVYPFVPGKNGYHGNIEDHHWIELGTALKQIHASHLPPYSDATVPREAYDPTWREQVKGFQQQVEKTAYSDPVAEKLANFMRTKVVQIERMVNRATELVQSLQKQKLNFVLCHSDCHPGNYLLGDDLKLYLVDWDNPIYAPKERDLMFFGAGMAGDQPGGKVEHLFYLGYEPGTINMEAIAYYRYERIIQDIAEFCKQLLLTDAGEDDREQAYSYFTSSFASGRELEAADMAYQSLKTTKEN